MLDSLVRVSRRVLRVPKAVASLTGNSKLGQSEDTACKQLTRLGVGARSVPSEGILIELAAGLTHIHSKMDWLRPDTVRVPSRSRPGDRGSVACAQRRRATGNHSGRRPTRNGSRRSTKGEVHDYVAGTFRPKAVYPRALGNRERTHTKHGVSSRQRKPASSTMNLPIRSFGFLRFTPERFHVLLNSLFKVLFNFPSRYLFAIGLVVIFSLRWSLPPT